MASRTTLRDVDQGMWLAGQLCRCGQGMRWETHLGRTGATLR